MTRHRRARLRILAVIVVAAAIGGVVFATTASNTVPATSAGAGSAAISGYTITGVAYNLNATTSSNIDSVSFTLNPAAASTVKVQLVNGGTWYSCTNTAGSVSCTTTSPQATVAAADQLSVLAVQ